MLTSRSAAFGISILGIVFLAGCAQKQMPDRPEPSYLEMREIHHRTIELSEAEWAQVHINMAHLALDRDGNASHRFAGVARGRSTTGLTYVRTVDCADIQETAFGLPVPCIDQIRFNVERTGTEHNTNLELYVTRHLPTTAFREEGEKVRVIQLDNKDNRPIKHDSALHARMFSELSYRLGIKQLQGGLDNSDQFLWQQERMPEVRRYEGASPQAVAEAFQAATSELGIDSLCEPLVIDHSGRNTDDIFFQCRIGSPSFLHVSGDNDYCRALITPTRINGADVRLRCYQRSAVRYGAGSSVTPVVPSWRQRLFDSLGRIIFIDAQEIPVREL